MDDLKIIIWIIIGLIYLFSRRKKADAPQPRQARQEDPEEAQADERPIPKSFEELLREIEGMKQPAPPPPPPKRYEPVVDYDEDIRDEKEDLEDIRPTYRRPDDEIYKTYEDAKAQAFYRPSLEETVKLTDTIVRFKQFKGYEKETSRNLLNNYLQELRDPQGFKKAFIMSEILRRRF